MSEHFVEYINIEKYKCFEKFSAKGFKRVNLISGKNNVGKTTLIEAVVINAQPRTVASLLKALWMFTLFRYLPEFSGISIETDFLEQKVIKQAGKLASESNINSVSFDCDESGISRTYSIKVKGESVDISEQEMSITSIMKNTSTEGKMSMMIPSSGLSQKILIKHYSSVQVKDKELDFDRYLNSVDDSIIGIKIIGGSSFECKVKGKNGETVYRPINDFGDGLRQFVSIIIALFKTEDRYLVIDELGNGIHYSLLDQLWEIVLTLSKELNVQVFATTHSKECIESYCRVAQKLEDEEVTFTTLVRNKEKSVKAITLDYEMFVDSIHDGREVRGW